jgi:GT2 family glycosyltransferase
MRFGAFVITFHRASILRETLKTILNQTRRPDVVLVVDNGNSVRTQEVVKEFARDNVVYYPLDKNLGPAGASAEALRWLRREGYEWVYWGDDDNPPNTADTLERLAAIASSQGKDVGGIGAVGSLFDWEKGELRRIPDEELSGLLDVDVISGSSHFLMRSDVTDKAGFPDARLFFGFYEPEFCLRIRKAGYRLIVDGDLAYRYRSMFRRLGIVQKPTLVSRYHYKNMWQRYYRTRNVIFMMRNTFDRPDLALRETLKAGGRVMASWLRGPRYGVALTALQIRGVIDGFRGRMGPTIMPKPEYKVKKK